MSSRTIAATKARLILSSNEAYKHEANIESYADTVNHLLGRCATEVIVPAGDDNVQNFKQGS